MSASRNAEEVLSAAGVSALFDERVDGVAAAGTKLPGTSGPATFLERQGDAWVSSRHRRPWSSATRAPT